MHQEPAQGSTPQTRIDDLVKADKLRLLFHQSYPALFVSLAVASLLCWILWDYADTMALLVWLGVLFLSSLVRLYLFLAYFRAGPEEQNAPHWVRPYIVTLLASALIWGVGLLFVMPRDSLLGQAYTLFVLIGMAGGALATYSAYRYMAIVAMLSILLPASLWLLFQGGKVQIGMAIGTLIFMAMTIRGSRILTNALHRNFHLSHELKRARDIADTQAKTDALTGISNRRAFFERGEQIISYCERNRLPLCALLMDVDHFKRINDSMGHHFGDMALRRIGKILEKEFRKSDVLGRLGGEEFAILLPDTTLEEAESIAELLRLSIAATPITYQDQEQTITVSIGIASGSYDLETLLPKADAAMYQAKSQGRNRVVTAR